MIAEANIDQDILMNLFMEDNEFPEKPPILELPSWSIKKTGIAYLYIIDTTNKQVIVEYDEVKDKISIDKFSHVTSRSTITNKEIINDNPSVYKLIYRMIKDLDKEIFEKVKHYPQTGYTILDYTEFSDSNIGDDHIETTVKSYLSGIEYDLVMNFSVGKWTIKLAAHFLPYKLLNL